MDAESPIYREHRFASADRRLELFARDYGGEGQPLLLMHGLTRNSADFEPLARHLAPQYRLIVPDQRGRGSSQHDPEPANYRPDVYAQDMFALLEELGIARAPAIGTSMGGLVAMLMAASRPQTVPALVLNDIGPEIDPAGLERIASYVGGGDSFASWDDAALSCAAINAQAFPDFAEADWQAFARRACIETEDGRVAFAYDPQIARGFGGDDGDGLESGGEGGGERGSSEAVAPADLWPLWDALSAIPTLLVRGALSDLLSSETVERMRDRHSGPFAHVDVPRRGHAPMLDEPEALNAICGFLAAHGQR